MIKELLAKIVRGEDLKEKEMEHAITFIMEGKATPSQIAAFITALRMKGETADEICGAARAMRKKALSFKINTDDTILDTCGTGGDACNTFNISTACAFVAAAGGVKVAKHGNRAVSSKSGSADVLEALGIKIDLSAELVKRCIEEIGIGFLFAPIFHRAMKYASAPRKEIGIRTIFNLLGPLTNPVGADVQVLGVFSPELTERIAYVLMRLGIREAMVVSGLDKMDEISICAVSRISHLRNGDIKTFHVSPEDFGIMRCPPDEIEGGGPRDNARIIMDIFSGEKGAKRDAVLINSAAALVVSGKAKDLSEGIRLAQEIIDSGLAIKKLNELKEFTHSL